MTRSVRLCGTAPISKTGQTPDWRDHAKWLRSAADLVEQLYRDLPDEYAHKTVVRVRLAKNPMGVDTLDVSLEGQTG